MILPNMDVNDFNPSYNIKPKESAKGPPSQLGERMADYDTNLEIEIRNIIYDDYGVGHQNIDSEEIYDKLVAKGINPPELAMADVFDSLKKRGLIKGPARMNREAAHKPGAYSIMWVSRKIPV